MIAVRAFAFGPPRQTLESTQPFLESRAHVKNPQTSLLAQPHSTVAKSLTLAATIGARGSALQEEVPVFYSWILGIVNATASPRSMRCYILLCNDFPGSGLPNAYAVQALA